MLECLEFIRELDFLAMHGVNSPLILAGVDGVLYKVLMEFRFKKETALEFIAGAGYFINISPGT